jgi:hypothetical protein
MTSTFRTTAVCLSALSMLWLVPSARAQTGSAAVDPGAAPATDAVTIGSPATWDAPSPGAASDADCRGVRDWEAAQREWMRRSSEWCSVEVGFRYRGAGGDVKMVVSKKSASSRSGRALHASVDLPANGGETSPMQFIFPCPTQRAERLCLNYESTTDAGELSYDYQQLGVDSGAGVEHLLEQMERPGVESAGDHPLRRTSQIVSARYLAADSEPDLRSHVASIAELEFAAPAPAPAPLGKLRKRAR